MTPEDVGRTFPFTVRPGHMETLDSYTRRILAANGEPDALQKEILKVARGVDNDASWVSVLEVKAGRNLERLSRPDTRPPHADCERCAALLTTRWGCVLCHHGESVQEHAHMDSFLCERHHRWTGPGTETSAQTATTSAQVAAHRKFRRLRRDGRIDMPLLLALIGTLARDLRLSAQEVFEFAVASVAWVTRRDTLRRIFDPSRPYSETFAWVSDALANITGAPSPVTVRTVWLRLWPAHVTLQSAFRGYGDYHQSHPHDFELPEGIEKWFSRPERLQTAEDYLSCAGLDRIAALTIEVDAPTQLRPVARHAYCSKGHRYLEVLTSHEPGQTPCPRCTKAHVVHGVNDLASVAPSIAAQLHPTLNGDLTAGGIAAASHRSVWWLCPEFHPYRATPANRTLTGLQCAVCLGRVILVGVNDLATTHPDVAAELHPGGRNRNNPRQLTVHDSKRRMWLCPEGHEYQASVKRRVSSGKSCTYCARKRNRTSGRSFADTHPELAATWRPELNAGRDARDYTSGSKLDVVWWCEKGHPYEMRVEARARGCVCRYCAGRRILPGFNDFATTHPYIASEWHRYLNWKRPSEVMHGSNDAFVWECPHGHKTKQSIPHRIASGGCVECPKGERAASRLPAKRGTTLRP